LLEEPDPETLPEPDALPDAEPERLPELEVDPVSLDREEEDDLSPLDLEPLDVPPEPEPDILPEPDVLPEPDILPEPDVLPLSDLAVPRASDEDDPPPELDAEHPPIAMANAKAGTIAAQLFRFIIFSPPFFLLRLFRLQETTAASPLGLTLKKWSTRSTQENTGIRLIPGSYQKMILHRVNLTPVFPVLTPPVIVLKNKYR
jgi:hypothetical protein